MTRQAVVRWALVVILMPFAVQGLLFLAMQVCGLVRYRATFFTDDYLQRYATAGVAAKALEQALRTDDHGLLAELEGLRWPRHLGSTSDMSFIMLWNRTGRYSTYLYFDSTTYERQLIPFEQVRGRWVAAPRDLYYAFRSGRWWSYFLPSAVAWWLVGAAELAVLWSVFRSARFRSWVAGR